MNNALPLIDNSTTNGIQVRAAKEHFIGWTYWTNTPLSPNELVFLVNKSERYWTSRLVCE